MTYRMDSKADRNQVEIVDALRQAGAVVVHLHNVGQGIPDLLVSTADDMYLMEVKMPGGVLTPSQAKFFREWPHGAHVVRSVDEALRLIGVKA